MKTVLFVSHSAELNGAERWLLDTLRGLDRRAYRPLLVVPRNGPLIAAAEAAGVETSIIPAKWWLSEKRLLWRQPIAWLWNRGSVRRLAALIRERGIDLVFSNSAATFGGALAAEKAGVPHVWSIHEILRGERALLGYFFGPAALGRFILNHSARVIVNSETTGAAFPSPDKIVLIPNGLEVKAGDPSRREEFRRAYGLGEADLGLAVVGKIYPEKGQREAVEAFNLLASKYPRLRLFLVGAVKDSGYADRIRRAARARGLEDRVVFTGYIEDLTDFLKLMTAVVVSSAVESFGRAALEGMASGTPVVAVRSGGLIEVVEDGVDGVFASSAEPPAIARALESILESPGRRQVLIENGFKKIREKFSLRRQVREVERVLAEVLAGTLFVPPLDAAGRDGPLFAQGREPGQGPRGGNIG
jgi:predicted outer membrane repeat protein